jgi:hypothetical protein
MACAKVLMAVTAGSCNCYIYFLYVAKDTQSYFKYLDKWCF